MSPHKLKGKSVTQEDYPAYDLAPAPPPSRPSYTLNLHAFDARTTTQDIRRVDRRRRSRLSRLEHSESQFEGERPRRTIPPTSGACAAAESAELHAEPGVRCLDDNASLLRGRSLRRRSQQARAPGAHKFEGKSVTQEDYLLRSGACAAAESAELHTEPARLMPGRRMLMPIRRGRSLRRRSRLSRLEPAQVRRSARRTIPLTIRRRPPPSRPSYTLNPRLRCQDDVNAMPIRRGRSLPAQPAQQATPVAPQVRREERDPGGLSCYDLASAPPPSRPSYTPNPHAFDAGTTNADALAWPRRWRSRLSRLEHQ